MPNGCEKQALKHFGTTIAIHRPKRIRGPRYHDTPYLPEELHRSIVRSVSFVIRVLFPERHVKLGLSCHRDLQLRRREESQNLRDKTTSRCVEARRDVCNPHAPRRRTCDTVA